MRDYRAFLDDVMAETVVFRDRQRAAFAEERDRWAVAPEFVAPELTTAHLPDDHPTASHSICATLAANVWKVLVTPGTAVVPGDVVAVLEAMKMEIPITADVDGVVTAVCCQPGDLVLPGQPLASIDVTTTI